jgi:hypothetical protein
MKRMQSDDCHTIHCSFRIPSLVDIDQRIWELEARQTDTMKLTGGFTSHRTGFLALFDRGDALRYKQVGSVVYLCCCA